MLEKLSSIQFVLKAELLGEDCAFSSVSIDTRTLQPGALFVAIEGEHFDGHDFLKQAKEKGAVAAIVRRSQSILPALQVSDPRIALGQLARWWTLQCKAKRIAITGSCGKTTTKSLLAAIMDEVGPTLATVGTLNNDYGVPLTLLNLESEHDYAVIEMGANHVGEIDYLVNLVHPDVSIITCVAPVHLEGFGSLEDIAHGKGEILNTLKSKGTAILNRDDPFYELWCKQLTEQKCISFGLSDMADVRAKNIQTDRRGYPQFECYLSKQMISIQLQLLGEHNVMNALAAAAAAYACGVSNEQIQRGLEKARGTSKRLIKQQGEKGCQIIDDCYNANPCGFAAALKVLQQQPGEKILILGDMAELGSKAEYYHRLLAKQARASGVQSIYAIGEWSRFTVEEFGQNAFHFPEKKQLIHHLMQHLKAEMCVLVKGSRSMRLEEVVTALLPNAMNQ